jgi:hypothetical protein
MSEMLTVGEIARTVGEPRARVDYAIEKAGIRERRRAGILRLFSRDQLPVIEAALRTVRLAPGTETQRSRTTIELSPKEHRFRE